MKRQKKFNTAKLTEEYVMLHPSIRDCLKEDIVNFSALSRKIAKELGISKKTSIDAILVACRRLQEKMRTEVSNEEKVRRILKKSKLEIRNKIAVFIIEKREYYDMFMKLEKHVRKRFEVFHIVEGSHNITLITSDDFAEEVRETFKAIVSERIGLAEIIIKSPEEIEDTSGVIAYLYSRMAQHGINIIESMSCWTDTLFVIDEKDIARTMEVLRF